MREKQRREIRRLGQKKFDWNGPIKLLPIFFSQKMFFGEILNFAWVNH